MRLLGTWEELLTFTPILAAIGIQKRCHVLGTWIGLKVDPPFY
jgi:hypothetical protein